MALIAKHAKKLIDEATGKKETKTQHFLNGLKHWITSPGGIITIVLIIGVVWYVHHNYKEKA